MGHRRSPMGYRSLVAIVGAALLAAGPVAGSPAVGAAPPAIHGVVRLDQVGYAIGEAKRAFLLAEAPVGTPRFTVVDGAGRTVLSGRVGRRTGGWNGRYRAVHRIDFSALRRPGRYRIVVDGLAAASPAFRVATRHDLFGKLVDDTVRFFQVQRDGAQVPRRLDRRPSHLTDRRATVYATPVFEGDGGDVPAAPLRPVGGPVDVEGGWFDAGDFVKFTHATAYSVAELLLVQRGLHREDHALAAETRHGLRWLDKVWDERHKVLYAQVGLGTGSERFGFVGDHDVWRLPEADDALRVRPGDDEYFIKYRPVFRAAPPGARISPNLAGRVAAAFALGAQVEARRDHQRARALLQAAASVFAMARTTRVGELVTAYPHAYYPEDSGRTTWSSAPSSWRWPPGSCTTGGRRAGCGPPPTGQGHTWAARTARRSTCTTPAPWPTATWCWRCGASRGRPGSRSVLATSSATCGGSWRPAPGRPGASPSARRWT
jgi:endoglucanase